MLHRNAIKAYQVAEQDSLVDGADPHTLVQILFDELIRSLELAKLAMDTSDLPAKSAHVTKSLTLLHVLATSLDFEKGGEVATSLSQLYDWSRRKVIIAGRDKNGAGVEEVRRTISEIASAWHAIAKAA